MTDHVVDLVTGYARAGVGVFPLTTASGGVCSCGWAECPSPGKHPVIRNAHRKNDPQRGRCKGECGRLGHGVHDATTDLGLIAEWMAEHPGCNWAAAPPPGVVVVDVDPRNGGDTTLDEWEARHGRLPNTLTCRTGSGGWHLWFSFNGPSVGKLGAGVDLKKAGGYVVAPPSVHACGGVYEWTDTRPAAAAPRWLREKLTPLPAAVRDHPAYAAGHGSAGLVATILKAQEGERNRVFYWACCRAAEGGLDHQPLIDAAISIGLPQHEAVNTARSAEHAPAKAGR